MIVKSVNNINALFKIFIEFAKYEEDGKLQIKDFFRMFLGFNVYICKYFDLTENEVHNFNNLFLIRSETYWNGINYCIVNLDNYRLYTNFSAKRLDANSLYSKHLIKSEDKKFIKDFVKLYNCRSPYIIYDCIFAKINEENPFYIFYTNITHNKNLIKYFTNYSFLFEDDYLQNYSQIVNNFVEDDKKWLSRYFIQLPRKIIDNNLIINSLMLRLSGYYNNTCRRFMIGIHVENFGDLDFEAIKNRIPAYSIHFNVSNKNELYKIIDIINNNLSYMNYSYKESFNDVFIIDYYIELKYTYNDVFDFLKQLLLASYIAYL